MQVYVKFNGVFVKQEMYFTPTEMRKRHSQIQNFKKYLKGHWQ